MRHTETPAGWQAFLYGIFQGDLNPEGQCVSEGNAQGSERRERRFEPLQVRHEKKQVVDLLFSMKFVLLTSEMTLRRHEIRFTDEMRCGA